MEIEVALQPRGQRRRNDCLVRDLRFGLIRGEQDLPAAADLGQMAAKPILWPLHSTHHSIEELNAFNSYHHIFEDLLRVPLMTIPMAVLVSVSVPQIAVTVLLLSIHGQLIHANTKLKIGPLRYLLGEPRYHRIHHSLERLHWNKNYAASFPIWDVIFGTVHFPRKDEYPRTGLSYVREPRSLAEYPRRPPSSEPANR
jgi:sterol desaturase/sphingolipid hydroxylase (fatty acid hydroxylase superfamily)